MCRATVAAPAATSLHTAPVVLPISAEPIRDGAVAVAGDRITWVGAATAYTGTADRVLEWPGILTPGLVNAHTHLQYTDFADLCGLDAPFPEWIGMMLERRRTFDDDMWRASAWRGIEAAIATGTTCVADVVTDPCVLGPLASSGLAGTGYVEAVGLDSTGWAERGRAALVAALDRAPAGFTLGVSPHTVYTLGTEVFADCARVGRAKGLRVHPHLAETADEAEFVLTGTGAFANIAERLGWAFELIRDRGSGLSPAGFLDSLGVLGPDTHVAHGVHISAGDRELLRRANTAVALCPRSNAILSAGTAPVAAYRSEGNPVGIGTDSLASSPSLDPFDDVTALYRLAVDQGSPVDGLARWLVEAVTRGGARALGLSGSVGVLRPGARADLAAFDVPTGGDPYAALVGAGGGNAAGTVLSGRVAYQRVPA